MAERQDVSKAEKKAAVEKYGDVVYADETNKKYPLDTAEMSEIDLGEYEKQILRFGEWKHEAAPNGILKITKEFGKKLVENFKKSPFVPVTRGHINSYKEAEQNPELLLASNIEGLELRDDG